MILFDARAVRRRGLREGFRRETVESLDLFVRATREFELRRRHDDGFDASWDEDDERDSSRRRARTRVERRAAITEVVQVKVVIEDSADGRRRSSTVHPDTFLCPTDG